MDRDEMRIFGRIEKHLDDIAKSLHNLERLKRVGTFYKLVANGTDEEESNV